MRVDVWKSTCRKAAKWGMVAVRIFLLMEHFSMIAQQGRRVTPSEKRRPSGSELARP